MLLIVITAIVTACGAIYSYLVWNFGYWKKRNVPGPEPRPLLGSLPSLLLRNRPVLEELDQIYRDYKAKFNFVGVFSVREPQILVTSPDLAKGVLIKHFRNFHDNLPGQLTNKESEPLLGRNPFLLSGDQWKAKRAEITPAFTTSRMKALFSIVEAVSSQMTKYVKQNTTTTLEARELAAKFTTDVVSNCIFAADAQSFTNEHSEIREMGRKTIHPSFLLIAVFIGSFPNLAKLLRIRLIPKSIERFFTNLMVEAVRYRESNSVRRADYLEHLINLRNKKELTELDMAAHGVTFFIDGFETSSLAMAFTLYELGRNPDVQKRLRREIREHQDDISYDTLLELPYLEQVLNESLRMWPPAAFLMKVCTDPMDVELTESRTVRIERDIGVIVPVWSLHHDPDCYENPYDFNPERFNVALGGVNGYREKGCYIPFGDGPRQCLGMRFARMQVKRGIYELVKNFEVSVDPRTSDPLRLDRKQFMTVPEEGIWLNFKPIGD